MQKKAAILTISLVLMSVAEQSHSIEFSVDGIPRPDSYWEALWRGEPHPVSRDIRAACSAIFKAGRWLVGAKPPPQTTRIPRAIELTGTIPIHQLSSEYTATKNRSKNNRGKLFQLEGSPHGVVLNGKVFPEFDLFLLPQKNIPVAILNPSAPPVARVILLHGLGYSISNVFSVTSTARTLHNIGEANSGDPFSKWFVHTYPDLKIPVQIVLIDVPPMGWAPSLESLGTAFTMSEHIREVVAEINQLQPLRNFYISRSASGPLSLLAGKDEAGVIITGATLPTRENLEANRVEVQRLERDENETPDWNLINKLLSMFESTEFSRALVKVAQSPLPVRSLVGREDAETPWNARVGWAEMMRFHSRPLKRSQHIIDGAGHQVYRRPDSLPMSQFSETDPDVIAFRLTLEFLREFSLY